MGIHTYTDICKHLSIYKCTHVLCILAHTSCTYIVIFQDIHTEIYAYEYASTHAHTSTPLPLLPLLHPTHNTSSEIHWQCVLCRHEITSQKFFKGRTGAQTSEGSRVEPKLIHYMCCICLLLKSPEHSGCLSRSLFLTL